MHQPPVIALQIPTAAAPYREAGGAPPFRERLDEVLRQARRSGEGFAIAILDLDRAGEPASGRGVSDDLSCGVLRRLRETVRECDVAARIAGASFGVLLVGVYDEAGTATALRRIARAFTTPLPLADTSLVGVSVGGCLWTPGVKDADTLVCLARQALARAKVAGGGRCRTSVAVPGLDADSASAP